MATKNNKLYNLEILPPPEVWAQITSRLDREYNAEEVPVAQKMYDMEFVPPTGMWDAIAATLPQEQELAPVIPVKRSGKVIAFARMATAAAAMVLITLTAWYFLNNSSDKDNSSIATTKQSTVDSGTANATSGDVATTQNNNRKLRPASTNNTGDEGSPIASRYSNRNREPLAYADQASEARASYASARKSGSAVRKLRNAKGQWTSEDADYNDNCYMNITSPNGEQTRTSSKFMQILNSLNSDDDAPGDYFDFMLQDNTVWKSRIREWKNKLLNQTSFIPSAGSFSDILELRDMLLQENQPTTTTDNQ